MLFRTATVAFWTILSSSAAPKAKPSSTARQGTLLAVGLRYIGPARRLRPVGSPMDPCVQISEVSVKVCGIGRPSHAVHAGSRLALERVERFPEQIDAQMVEERGEPRLLPLPCGLPYTGERLGHASPVSCRRRALSARRPVRAVLVRVPLGCRRSVQGTASPWGSTNSAASVVDTEALFAGFAATMAACDFSRSRASSATAPRLSDADRQLG